MECACCGCSWGMKNYPKQRIYLAARLPFWPWFLLPVRDSSEHHLQNVLITKGILRADTGWRKVCFFVHWISNAPFPPLLLRGLAKRNQEKVYDGLRDPNNTTFFSSVIAEKNKKLETFSIREKEYASSMHLAYIWLEIRLINKILTQAIHLYFWSLWNVTILLERHLEAGAVSWLAFAQPMPGPAHSPNVCPVDRGVLSPSTELNPMTPGPFN